jgi:diacylglycerol kinase (ATP)
MTAKVILNPYAGRWKALRKKGETEEALHNAGVAYDLCQTEGSGHAIELAKNAALAGYSPIIIAGGDGTIGEVVNGLYLANPEGILGPVGLLPLGTANDVMTNLQLPLDLPGAAEAIAKGKLKRIDLGKVNQWVFSNNSAVGLEPVVTIYNIRMVRLRGMIRYLVAALRAILSGPRWQMTIAWDEGLYQGPVSLVSVGNNPVTGGLFRMAPAADPTDGKLTFVYGYAPTRRKMLTLLPRAMSGDYVNDPAIHQHHTCKLEISSEEPTPLQVDGEIRCEAGNEFIYEILPSRLDLFVP